MHGITNIPRVERPSPMINIKNGIVTWPKFIFSYKISKKLNKPSINGFYIPYKPPCVRLLVGLAAGLSVYYKFLKGREGTLPCSHRSKVVRLKKKRGNTNASWTGLVYTTFILYTNFLLFYTIILCTLISRAAAERWEFIKRKRFKKEKRKHAFDQEKCKIQEKRNQAFEQKKER